VSDPELFCVEQSRGLGVFVVQLLIGSVKFNVFKAVIFR
jgi:hypothetical protein